MTLIDEFTRKCLAIRVARRINAIGVIETLADAMWENGYCESLNGKLRDECLNAELFYSLKEAQTVIECWRVRYNTKRPHSALGYRPPTPLTLAPQLDQVQTMQ